jgi:signal transduction histidine kinase
MVRLGHVSAPAPHVRALRTGIFLATACATLLLSAPRAHALNPAQSLEEATVEVWGLRDGLTGSMVRSLAQTDDGYLWVAGFGGVARYDGARIVRLEIEPALDVMGMIAQPDGVLWIIPRRGPLVCTRRGAIAPCPAGTPLLPPNARVYAVHQTAQGEAVVGTDFGIYRQKGGAFVLDVKAKGMDFGDAVALHVDRQGRLWVAGTNGVFRETATGYAPFASGDAPGTPARALFETTDGRLWVLTEAHLLLIEGEKVTSTALPPALMVAWQSQLIEDRDGNVWIGGQKGLGRLRRGHFDIYDKSDGLPHDGISALFEDREGSLWVGTRNGSLAQFTDRTVTTKLGPPLLAEESIEAVNEAPDGTLWFGNQQGLLRWKDGVEHLYTKADGLPSDRVYVVTPTHDGVVWVGTDRGLARMRDGHIDRPVPLERPVYSIYEDREGVVWLGTDLDLMRIAGTTAERIPRVGTFAPGQIRGIGHDDRGTLWVSAVRGLGHVVGGKLAAADPALGPEITSADRGITRDHDGTLWMASGTALLRLRNGKFHVFPRILGPGRDWLFQILTDDHGFIWFGSSRTISRVARAALEDAAEGHARDLPIMSFDMTDTRREIAARRARNAGACKARDGRLWFATLRGVVTIDPTKVRTNVRAPTVLIERAMVDGQSAIPERQKPFPPGLGNLEFNYSGVTLLEPRRAMHRYQLEGFDPHWIEAGTRRVAYYTNIPPGKYRFRVQASNADGLWNTAGATIAIELAPHFYQTLWFYSLGVLLVGGIGFWFYRARLGRLRGQYLAVFAERSRVARELHDSLLQGMSAVALELANIRTALPASAAGPASRLEAVEDALTESLEETRRFVWNLREQPTGTGDLGLALTRLAGRLTEGHTVACAVEVEGTAVHLSHDAQGALFKIAQEAITNALRHAEARRIDVRLRYRDREVELVVVDDGRGFDPAHAEGPEQHHFGLVGMSERARRLGARLDVASQPGTGTRITFVLLTGSRRTTHA